MTISLHSDDILEKHLSTTMDVLIYSLIILTVCSRTSVLWHKC